VLRGVVGWVWGGGGGGGRGGEGGGGREDGEGAQTPTDAYASTRTHEYVPPTHTKKKQVDWDGCVNEVSGGKCKLNTCDTAHQVSPKAHIRKSTL